MKVKKANGDRVLFDSDKIRRALRRVKAKPDLIERVIEIVKRKLYDGIPTSELFRIVFRELKKMQRHVAGKYNLKRAIMDLGPSGFPFERFIAAVWQSEGFAVDIGKIIKGECVSHEVDVIARRGEMREFIECKHHSFGGKICDLKTALYSYARFLDIKKKQISESTDKRKSYKGWLVTNTRFSSDAESYGSCAGLELLSWDYPPRNGLRERVDRAGLHPITCLTSISKGHKRLLMDHGITLSRELLNQSEILRKIGINDKKAQKILDEASAICGITVRT